MMLIVVAVALSLCAGRLLQLQGFDSGPYAPDAFTRTLPLLPARGEITDRTPWCWPPPNRPSPSQPTPTSPSEGGRDRPIVSGLPRHDRPRS